MPKSIIVEPEKVLAKDSIHFSEIPVNAYDKPVEEELAVYSPDSARRRGKLSIRGSTAAI